MELSSTAQKILSYGFLKTENKLSALPILLLLYICSILWQLFRQKKVDSALEYLIDPFKVAHQIASKIVIKPLEFLVDSTIPLKRKINFDVLLQIVGAVCLLALFYIFTILLCVLIEGIHLDALKIILAGDWNQRAELLFGFLRSNILVNFLFVYLFLVAVYYHSLANIMEFEYDNAKRSGLEVVIPLTEWDDSPKIGIPSEVVLKRSRQSLRKAISGPSSNLVQVKLASGFEAIGPRDSPGFMVDILKGRAKAWQILLLDPESLAAQGRASSYLREGVNDPPIDSIDKYLQGIWDVLKHLEHIKQEFNERIEVRLISHTPVWKIYLLSEYVLVQTFGPGDRSDRTPLFMYRKGPTSLYHGFFFEFTEALRNAKVVDFPLSIPNRLSPS